MSMTTIEKLNMLKNLLGLTGGSEDALLGIYLSLAKSEIINWRYGASSKPNIAKITDSEDVPVGVSVAVFIAVAAPTSGTTYTFTYSATQASWQYNSANVELHDYGIAYDDYYTPIDAETITVKYNENYLAEYDMVQIMACVVGYGLSGAENQQSHSENGISRAFNYSDMLDYIHGHVVQIAGVR